MKLLLSLIIVAFIASAAHSQSYVKSLPKGAVVLETRTIPVPVNRDRELVLWMLDPKKNPNGYAPDEIYTCPDYTRGSYFSGPLRVSLVDTQAGTIINTVSITKDYEEGADYFDIPYAIRKGYQYFVPAQTKSGVEVKPTIMRLQDYNGDGEALEFALFDAMACMGLETSLIGYSKSQDKVIQYPIGLEVVEGAKRSKTTTKWVDYLFSKKSQRPGYWQFEIDYRGRGGTLDKWEVRYLPTEERFAAKLVVIPDEQ